MLRWGALVTVMLAAGCTVAWSDLRTESKAPPASQCPAALTVNVASGATTNTFGPKERNPEQTKELEKRYRELAEATLHTRHCALKQSPHGETLNIKVEEMQQLSALPQEWLTGLSLGLIPSWGTGPAELRFSFAQGSRTASYVVDDKRVNHLILFPVFWISFFLDDSEKEFRNALNDFTASP